jgi:hypothetical protein
LAKPPTDKTKNKTARGGRTEMRAFNVVLFASIFLVTGGVQLTAADGLTADALAKLKRKAIDDPIHGPAFNLGVMYEDGAGVPKDLVEAVKWYRFCADKGSEHCQVKLGEMYKEGKGVPKDFVLAYMWFNLAASHEFHSHWGKLWRDEIEERMTPAQIAEAQKLAREWKPTTQSTP